MKSVWNAREHQELKTRVGRLTPEHAAKWGRMNVAQMVVHLSDSLRMASGELPVEPKDMRALRFPPLKNMILFVLPFPKGAPTAPELLLREPGAWPVEVADLHDQLDRFVSRGPSATTDSHPAFGRMSARQWGVLVYRHMDHHLKQFGC
jgi:hypothetical protein